VDSPIVEYNFEYHAFFVGLFVAFPIAFARHPRAAHAAARRAMPSLIRVVFAHPSEARTIRTIFFHVKNARSPLQRSRAYRAPFPFSEALRPNWARLHLITGGKEASRAGHAHLGRHT
jgi:hypothetical protein